MTRGFVYLDSSVVLAHVLLEDVRPPDRLWSETLISSRLLDYETWVRINKQGLKDSHGDAVEQILAGIHKLEIIEPVVWSLREEVPAGLRTLDALHFASIRFLVSEGQDVRLATYDRRLADVARATGIGLYPLT